MSLSHSLAADVLSRTSSNMLNNATESSRACGRAGVIPPFLWFRARPKPPRSGVLDQATLALVPLNLDGSRRRKTPFSGWSRSMSNPASRSNSPRAQEGEHGFIMNTETGKPYDVNHDACVERGPHLGYNEAATAATTKAIKEFLTTQFKLKR
jgi:hypothetical protein